MHNCGIWSRVAARLQALVYDILPWRKGDRKRGQLGVWVAGSPWPLHQQPNKAELNHIPFPCSNCNSQILAKSGCQISSAGLRHPSVEARLQWSAELRTVWKSRWPSWAPVPNKPTVSVDVKHHSTKSGLWVAGSPWFLQQQLQPSDDSEPSNHQAPL